MPREKIRDKDGNVIGYYDRPMTEHEQQQAAETLASLGRKDTWVFIAVLLIAPLLCVFGWFFLNRIISGDFGGTVDFLPTILYFSIGGGLAGKLIDRNSSFMKTSLAGLIGGFLTGNLIPLGADLLQRPYAVSLDFLHPSLIIGSIGMLTGPFIVSIKPNGKHS